MIKPQSLQRNLVHKMPAAVAKRIIFSVMLLCASMLASLGATITSFSPSSGPVGTLVTVKGSSLSVATIVTIGGVPAIIIKQTNTSIVAMVMPGAITGAVSATVSGGVTRATGDFTVTETPYPIAQQGRKLVDTTKTANWFPDYARGEGNSVAVSADGNTAIVCEAVAYNIYGSAVIYTRQSGRWVIACPTIPTIRTELYGTATSVAISADGSTAVIGGNQVSLSRPVVVLRSVNGSWSNPIVEYLHTPNYNPGYFSYYYNEYNARPIVIGNKVSITADGKTILIGTGTYPQTFYSTADTIRIFNRSGNEWKQAPNPRVPNYRYFGYKQDRIPEVGAAVAISADGKTVALVSAGIAGGRYGIGAVAGYTLVYNRPTRTSNNWSPQKLLPKFDRVCLSADGNTLIGTYYPFDFGYYRYPWPSNVYTRSGNEWTFVQGIEEGGEASISADGNTLMIANNATVYTRQGGTFVKKAALKPGFAGVSASVSSDGTTAFIGNPNDATTVVTDPENNFFDYQELGAVYAFSSSQPELPASAITFANTTGTTTSVSWTNGSGTGRAVFIKDTIAGEPSPEDIYYSSNVRYHSGYPIGKTGWYCIYNGTGSAVNVVGLTGGKTYRVAVMEYKGTVDKPFFIQSEIEPANVTTPIEPPTGYATGLTFTNTTATSTTLSWLSGNGSARAVFLKAGTRGELNVVQAQTYTGNGKFKAGSPVGTNGWYCVYNGTGNTVNLLRLTASTTYRAIVIEYNGAPGMEAYNLTRYNAANVTTTANANLLAASINNIGIAPNNIGGPVVANNILSPNGDGKNDTWIVNNLEYHPNNTVSVVDGGGNTVFSKKGYANDWAGTYKGDVLKEGTYYYTIDLGNSSLIKGFFTVVRDK